jgi:hypothetical protein
MTGPKLLGAAAVLGLLVAAPAQAQEVIYNPGYCAQFYPNANCQNRGPNNPYTGDYQRRQSAYRGANNFWPGDVAAGVVGGAIGTAGALATAPFGGGSYDSRSYAARNGFVCQPGTMFRDESGRVRPCQ